MARRSTEYPIARRVLFCTIKSDGRLLLLVVFPAVICPADHARLDLSVRDSRGRLCLVSLAIPPQSGRPLCWGPPRAKLVSAVATSISPAVAASMAKLSVVLMADINSPAEVVG
jgi:hypothetical protein